MLATNNQQNSTIVDSGFHLCTHFKKNFYWRADSQGSLM